MASKSEWGDSDSAGYTNRAPGRKDGTFETEGKFDTGTPIYNIFSPGDIVLCTLWMDYTALYWHFPRAMNLDFKLSINIDTEEVIGWQASWGADGIFYRIQGQIAIPISTPPIDDLIATSSDLTTAFCFKRTRTKKN